MQEKEGTDIYLQTNPVKKSFGELIYTGGPPLTRFPLTRFLAYVRVSGGISVSRGPQYSPTNTSFM